MQSGIHLTIIAYVHLSAICKYTLLFKSVYIYIYSAQLFSTLITTKKEMISRIISEGSCDEDWSNDTENSALQSQE